MQESNEEKDKIVFRVLIPNANRIVNEIQATIGQNSIREALVMADDLGVKDEFEEHIQLCDEVEGILKYLVLCRMPVSKGTRISVRNDLHAFSVEAINYKNLHKKKAILAQFFLCKVF
jgi:hypothetical protein